MVSKSVFASNQIIFLIGKKYGKFLNNFTNITVHKLFLKTMAHASKTGVARVNGWVWTVDRKEKDGCI